MPTDHTPDLQAREAETPLPCPFCGVVPSVEHRRTGWRIACNYDNCPTRPNGFSYETRGEAVEAWNTPLAASIRGAEERGAAREREECAEIAKGVYNDSVSPGWVYSAGGSALDHLQGEAAAADLIERRIRARAAADALEDRG